MTRFRVHRLTARGIGMIGNPSRRPERKKRRQDVAFHCKVENDNNPAFAARTQGEGAGRTDPRQQPLSICGRNTSWEPFQASRQAPPDSESAASETLTALIEISAMLGLASFPGRMRCMFHPRCGFSFP